MIVRLGMATTIACTLIVTWLASGSAQAASMPVLKGDAPPGLVTLIGRGGGRGGGGKHAGGRGGSGKQAYRGRGGRKQRACKGGGYGYYNRHIRRGHNYRRYRYSSWYGRPGYSGGGCGWLYRRAAATGNPYWWSRYYDCIGYY